MRNIHDTIWYFKRCVFTTTYMIYYDTYFTTYALCVLLQYWASTWESSLYSPYMTTATMPTWICTTKATSRFIGHVDLECGRCSYLTLHTWKVFILNTSHTDGKSRSKFDRTRTKNQVLECSNGLISQFFFADDKSQFHRKVLLALGHSQYKKYEPTTKNTFLCVKIKWIKHKSW